MGPELISLGIIWYVCFLFSLTCHEAAHALTAKWGGDYTAYYGGQVTLNPLPHVRREVFGTVVVPILSFVLMHWMIGWASAPFDPAWRDRYPQRAALMALAGPVANILIVIASGITIRLLLGMGLLALPSELSLVSIVAGPDPGAFSPLATALSILFSLNVLLAVFNLIPVPPLDGSSVIGLVMPEGALRRYTEFVEGGPLRWFGIIIAWQVVKFVFWPAMKLALGLLYLGV